MNKRVLVIAGAFLAQFIIFGLFYLQYIKFCDHIDITVEGPAKKPIHSFQVYGLTPLGGISAPTCDELSSANKKRYLFSDVLIDLSSIRPDSIRGISVRYGSHETYINKSQIIRSGDDSRIGPIVHLSKYISENNSRAKLSALTHLDMFGYFRGFYIKLIWPVTSFIGGVFHLSIPFLLLIIGFPILAIVFILRKKPLSAYRTPYTPSDLSKKIFFTSLLFSLVLLVYNIYYYQLFIQTDAVEDIFYCSSHNTFLAQLPGSSRFTYIFTYILLFPCFKLHLPLSLIGRIYSINNPCFHLLISFTILFFTRRYDLAAVVLAVPILLSGINYYYVVNELFLSGSIMILYIAAYQGLKNGPLRNLVLFTSMFFIIWSHPISLLVFFVFLAGMYTSWIQLKEDKWILAFILVNVCFRLSMLDSYDNGRIEKLNAHVSISDTARFILWYCLSYWYIIVLGMVAIYISFSRHKRIVAYAGLLIWPVIIYVCSVEKLNNGLNPDFSKFTYPINLFIIAQGTVLITAYADRYKNRVWALTSIAMLYCICFTFLSYQPLMTRSAFVQTLNNICHKHDPNQSKWFVRNDSLAGISQYDPYIGNSSILYSALQNLPVTVHIAEGDTELKKVLDTIPDDKYYCGYQFTSTTRQINPYYFNFKDGPYKELILDADDIRSLRKACNNSKPFYQLYAFD